MIIDFGDKSTEDIFNGSNTKFARKITQNLWPIAFRKLDMINSAQQLKDLLIPPANRLEKLKGRLAKFQSIRINDQYRIIFIWSDGNAHNVTITDYH